MKKTILSQTIRNLMICISAGGALAACGGGGDAGGSTKLLASTYTGITSGAVYVLVNPNSGKALDVVGAGTADGTNVDIWTKNGTVAQKWQINKNSDGTHTLINPNSGKALDDAGAGTASGTNVQIATPNGSNAQKWNINANSDGTVTLVNVNANKALDVTGAGTADGTNVEIWTTSSNAAQKWTLTQVAGSSPTPTPAPTPTPTPAPTPTPSCTYQTWSSGVNYAQGTIVKYPANGNFYKEVNAGTNGSDGTDPTISTWYWSPTTCGSSPTPTPTPSGFSSIVSQSQFNQMFPSANSFYTYQGLVNAAGAVSGFASTGSTTVQKQEAAAFLANVAHETGGLVYIEEIDKSGNYCDSSQSYGCPAGTYQYYGRGPLQISWNFNYKAAGDWMGSDLLNSPSLVATNATISWKSAMWYWMTQSGGSSMTSHNAMVNSSGFGYTIKAINGGLECNGNNIDEMNDRVNDYKNFTSILGVPTGSNLTC